MLFSDLYFWFISLIRSEFYTLWNVTVPLFVSMMCGFRNFLNFSTLLAYRINKTKQDKTPKTPKTPTNKQIPKPKQILEEIWSQICPMFFYFVSMYYWTSFTAHRGRNLWSCFMRKCCHTILSKGTYIIKESMQEFVLLPFIN